MEHAEKNKRTLYQAIRKLPGHNPPDGLWKAISDELDTYQVEPDLSMALQELPEHSPESDLWEKIEHKLDQPVRVPIRRRILPLAAAAAVLIGLLLILPLLNRQDISKATVSISYATEVVDDALLDRSAELEPDSYGIVEDLCSSQPFMCANPNVQAWKAELEELNEAKKDLEEALGAYETDTYLIGQLVEIEMERTQVIKKIMGSII